MKLLNFNKVLCLSPHPDDVEYSMSGTISKFNETQFDILTLTNGTATDTSTSTYRQTEVSKFWSLMNCLNANILTSDQSQFETITSAQWVTYLDKIIANGYDAIFTTSNKDAHQEHIFVNSLVPALTRNKPISIIEYKSPSTLHSWIPNYFIHLESEYTSKLNSLRTAFTSQIDSVYFNTNMIELFHTDYNCNKRLKSLTEQFNICTLYN